MANDTAPVSKSYTTEEAAEIISSRLMPGRPKRTARAVQRYCKLNKIPGAFIAFGEWHIPEHALEAFIHGKLNEPLTQEAAA